MFEQQFLIGCFEKAEQAEAENNRERKPDMKIEDLIERKKELGYTNEMISKKSGVPLSTVNKIFSGQTARPRYNNLQSIQCVLFPENFTRKEAEEYKDIAENLALGYAGSVCESSALDEYNAEIPVIEHKSGYEKMLSWKKQGEYTVEDWFSLPDGVRMELIDGVLYDLANPSRSHQFIAGQLYHELCNVTIEKGKTKCVPFIAPFGVQIGKDNKNMLEPDVMLVCDKEKYMDEDRIYGAPDFVAEVLSPTTRKNDEGKKLSKYWDAGVREYWIINPEDREVMVYMFGKSSVINRYSFDDQIPLGISEGKIVIDFKKISDRMKSCFGE